MRDDEEDWVTVEESQEWRSEGALTDLIDMALVFSAISAANEIIGQYRSWLETRAKLESADLPDTTARRIALDLDRLGELMDVARGILHDLAKAFDACIELIRGADPDLLEQIRFLNGWKARVRIRDRGRYRRNLDIVESSLHSLFRCLDDATDIVARVVPPVSREELVESGRVLAAEHKVLREVLQALGDSDTTFAQALELSRALINTVDGYLAILHEDAFGYSKKFAPS